MFNASIGFRPLLLFFTLVLYPSSQVRTQDSLAVRSPEYLLTHARQSLSAKSFAESILYYREYLNRRPNDGDVRNELARTYSWNAEYDSALAQYEIVLAKNRNNFDARLGRCRVLGWKHEYDKAIRETDELLVVYPRNIELLSFAASLYLTSRDFERSLALNQRILLMESGNLAALLGKCRALQGLGKSDEAFREIQQIRSQYPEYDAVEQLYASLRPKPRNQFFIRYQNESFDVQGRSDHRTVQAQYYRTVTESLTLYAEVNAYRRFDEDNQSFGAGGYYAMSNDQSLFAYCLVSPDPTVTSRVDASVEYNRVVAGPLSAFLAYRLLDFRTESVHIVSPGFSWTFLGGIELKPRAYISRTVQSRTTATALSIQGSYLGWENLMPYMYYAVGNEAYRGVTLDNVESSDSWSVTIGGRYAITNWIAVRANYQYLNRIGNFHENSLDVGLGYYW